MPHPNKQLAQKIEQAIQNIPYQTITRSESVISGNKEMYVCPIHNDTKPSLVVYHDRTWFCFGCRKAGKDVVDLIKFIEGISRRKALQLIVDKIIDNEDT